MHGETLYVFFGQCFITAISVYMYSVANFSASILMCVLVNVAIAIPTNS